MSTTKTLMSAKAMERTLERLAYQVLERHGEAKGLVMIGIQRRGVEIAERIKALLDERLDREIALGKLDINLYRDDWTRIETTPTLNRTDIPFSIDEKNVVVVDDVLYTGRTTRAALEALLDFGRPKRIELLVLIDRGHRELPIHADYVGKSVETAFKERVDVLVKERDGKDTVILQKDT